MSCMLCLLCLSVCIHEQIADLMGRKGLPFCSTDTKKEEKRNAQLNNDRVTKYGMNTLSEQQNSSNNSGGG